MKVKELYLTLSLMYTIGRDIRVRTRYSETVEMEWNEFAETFGEWFISWYDPSTETITIVREERELYEVERHDEHEWEFYLQNARIQSKRISRGVNKSPVMEQCCGTCKYRVPGEVPGEGDWVCNNAESEYYALETEYGFSNCVDYEERE